MSTSSVSYTVPSNGWTGSIDVTSCDLSSDISVFDVRIFYDGVEQGSPETANWSKVSVTSLSYSGSALNQNDVVRIERETPATQIVTVLPLQTISSSSWNAEFTRIYNILEEQRTYGLPDDDTVISDEAYGSGWNGITSQAPSKNAIYDKINTLETTTIPGYIEDDAYGVGWNGDTTHAPSQNAVYDVVAATIAQVNTNISNISANRDLSQMQGRLTVTSGNPLVATSASSTTLYYTPYGGTNVYLYDGSAWNQHTLSEISLALSGLTNGRPYDVFLYNNSGTLTLELTQWTNATTRTTAIAYQNGILVKSGTPTRRYIGTITPQATDTIYQGSKSETANASFYNSVYNFYNPVAGYYYNDQNVNLTSSGGVYPFYSNSGINITKGWYDNSKYHMTVNAEFTNTTGAAQQVIIYCYSNTLSVGRSIQGGYIQNNQSMEYCASSGCAIPGLIGALGHQPTYFTSSTSVTENQGVVEFIFVY